MAVQVKLASSEEERSELDELLWDVLWRPLGLPREARESMKLDSPQIELVATEDGAVLGGLVANMLSQGTIEIRHIAVKSDRQGHSIGRRLVNELPGLIPGDAPSEFQTFARNTSVGFFTKLGFSPRGAPLEHEDWAKHGIRFQQMHRRVGPSDQQ